MPPEVVFPFIPAAAERSVFRPDLIGAFCCQSALSWSTPARRIEACRAAHRGEPSAIGVSMSRLALKRRRNGVRPPNYGDRPMSSRLPAVALLTAMILAACSEAPTAIKPTALPPKPSLVMDAAVACTGVTMPVIECQALVALYNSTNGPAWVDSEGWTAGANPCRWVGVECTEGDHGSVLMLSASLTLMGPWLMHAVPGLHAWLPFR